MNLDVKDENGKLVIAPSESHHTLMTLIKRSVWDAGGKSGYNTGHPYEDDAGELVVEGDDPAETLKDAVEEARDRLEEFRDEFESA
ncbi:MAG: hypothetical protein SVQ76_00920 [Candidatus Nanohaloarchaea archaeon]|nr:hypothetical protein [Candidatus Nanohaloarchaea archaeon]